MNLRADLRAVLTAGLPGYVVSGTPADLDNINKPTVSFWAADLASTASAYAVNYTLQLVTPVQDINKVDDALDAMLTDVLPVLWDTPGYIVGTANRTTVQDKYHAWTITLSRTLRIERN